MTSLRQGIFDYEKEITSVKKKIKYGFVGTKKVLGRTNQRIIINSSLSLIDKQNVDKYVCVAVNKKITQLFFSYF